MSHFKISPFLMYMKGEFLFFIILVFVHKIPNHLLCVRTVAYL